MITRYDDGIGMLEKVLREVGCRYPDLGMSSRVLRECLRGLVTEFVAALGIRRSPG